MKEYSFLFYFLAMMALMIGLIALEARGVIT